MLPESPPRKKLDADQKFFFHARTPQESECGMGIKGFKKFREIKQLGKIMRSLPENHQNNGYLVCKMWDPMKKKADIYLHKYASTAIYCQAVFPRDLWKRSLLQQEPVLIVDNKYLLKRLFGSDLDSILWSRVVGGLTISSECLKGNDCVLKKKKIIKTIGYTVWPVQRRPKSLLQYQLQLLVPEFVCNSRVPIQKEPFYALMYGLG